MQKLELWINRFIAWSFYAIFFLVPLIIHPNTYELFEFNKMWFTFGMGLVILVLWFAKVVVTGHFYIRRTPLDIPLGLFLLSQLLSTIFSLDSHVSLWGYYSRFNGGFLSTLTYVFLYYAFATHLVQTNDEGKLLKKAVSFRLVLVSLTAGITVALWGLPSHFGYDPTCLVFRGALDVSCWTEAFHPKVRMFSTLGQPNWMAAYLAIVIPLFLAFTIYIFQKIRNTISGKTLIFLLSCVMIYIFYQDLLFTRSQSGFLGFWCGMVIFACLFFLMELKSHGFPSGTLLTTWLRNATHRIFHNKGLVAALTVIFIFLTTSFFTGSPVGFLEENFSYHRLKERFTPKPPSPPVVEEETKPAAPAPAQFVSAGEFGGSDSGKIRKVVWQGALEIFKQNPLFGTGVETFAFAYYGVKPKEHNLTSEWDYLYNKAHNEYLNYLATTGALGLGSYLFFIGAFLYTAFRQITSRINHEAHEPHLSTYPYLSLNSLFLIGFIAAFISILVSNFFGFSVVIVNLYLFLIPILFYDMQGIILRKNLFKIDFFKSQEGKSDQFAHTKFQSSPKSYSLSPAQISLISVFALIVIYFEFLLFRFWQADIQYAYGYNLNRIQRYQEAYEPLKAAVELHPGEDLFKDELSLNASTLAFLYAQQNQGTQAAQFAMEAKQLSDQVVANHPNNVVYYKTRTKVLYTLTILNPAILPETFQAITRANQLAPTDAKVVYNIGLIYNLEGNQPKAIEYFKKAIDLKPNYVDPNYTLAMLYHQLSLDPKTPSTDAQTYITEAKRLAEHILTSIDPNHAETKKLLDQLR